MQGEAGAQRLSARPALHTLFPSPLLPLTPALWVPKAFPEPLFQPPKLCLKCRSFLISCPESHRSISRVTGLRGTGFQNRMFPRSRNIVIKLCLGGEQADRQFSEHSANEKWSGTRIGIPAMEWACSYHVESQVHPHSDTPRGVGQR